MTVRGKSRKAVRVESSGEDLRTLLDHREVDPQALSVSG